MTNPKILNILYIICIQDAIQAQMVIQKMSELVVTSDSPIDDLDEDSSEGLQGPLSSISENPASPMTSLGNEADEEAKDFNEELEADTRNANYVNVVFNKTEEVDSENNIPVSIQIFCVHYISVS